MHSSSALELLSARELKTPTLIVAYAGWGDAGDSATHAIRYLLDQLSVSVLARIDTEDFLDFTVVRPEVRLREGQAREIVWPDHKFFAAEMGSLASDLVLGLGFEPHLRWRSYAAIFKELVARLGVRLVVLLGAYLDDVIYSQPTQVGIFSTDPELASKLELSAPRYEGPTGILGVLSDTLRTEGIPTLNLWARVPHYVATSPNWRASLALLQTAEAVTGLRFELSGIEESAGAFDETVSDLIANDPQLLAYVRELKRRAFSQ